MHYHYIPQMPDDGINAYCEDHCPQDDLQSGMVYVCDCKRNACVVCEELAIPCVFCANIVAPTDSSIRTDHWTAHWDCVIEYGKRQYGIPLAHQAT